MKLNNWSIGQLMITPWAVSLRTSLMIPFPVTNSINLPNKYILKYTAGKEHKLSCVLFQVSVVLFSVFFKRSLFVFKVIYILIDKIISEKRFLIIVFHKFNLCLNFINFLSSNSKFFIHLCKFYVLTFYEINDIEEKK